MTEFQTNQDLVGGRYHLLRQIGSGGTSTVHEAVHHLTQEKVAIKLIPLKQLSSDTRTVARFMREAKLSQEVQHPGIVKVTDAWIEKDKHCCLVMEKLNGISLRDAIQSGDLTRLQVVKWIIEALTALEVAHRAKIIHRDLKPENMFIHIKTPAEKDTMVTSEQVYFDEDSGELRVISSDEISQEFAEDFDTNSPTLTQETVGQLARDQQHLLQVKILDFGLSRTMIEPSVTQTGHLIGTPWYMSPEQILSPKTCTHLTDIWSVGVMLYEILTNKVPFQGKSIPGIILAIKELQISLQTLKDQYPTASDFFTIIEDCLQKDVSDRITSAASLKYRLENTVNLFSQTSLANEFVSSDSYKTPATQTASSAGEATQFNFGQEQEIEYTEPVDELKQKGRDSEKLEPQTLKLSSEAIQVTMRELRNLSIAEINEAKEAKLAQTLDHPFQEMDPSELAELPTLMSKSKSPFYVKNKQATNILHDTYPLTNEQDQQALLASTVIDHDIENEDPTQPSKIFDHPNKKTSDHNHDLEDSAKLSKQKVDLLNHEEPQDILVQELSTERLLKPSNKKPKDHSLIFMISIFIIGLGVRLVLKLLQLL